MSLGTPFPDHGAATRAPGHGAAAATRGHGATAASLGHGASTGPPRRGLPLSFPLEHSTSFFGLGATPSSLGPSARFPDHAKASSRQGSAFWPRCKYLRLCYDY